MSPLHRVAALAATAVAFATPVALAAPASAAPVGVAGTSVVTAGPICPDHPDVPLLGSYVGSEGNVDVYRVPNRFGFTFVRVTCD
ncbi:hypothetical protein AB0J14_31560 [Micromonospora arborensis]|uniref:hypothetical protein n=1 Tax=Micromonospora arborensis TaxID=2116518 RepID=UPI0034024C38